MDEKYTIFNQEAVSVEQAIKRFKKEKNSLEKVLYTPNRTRFLDDANRPQYHLIEPEKWMNEPHAPFFYNGYYHIFYQANLHAPIWDSIQWGHLASNDMVHWKDLPLALQSENGFYDELGCWSGSGLVDKDGVPRIYYTAGNNNRFPNQAVALAQPKDLEKDTLLKKWKKYPSLIKEQDIGCLGEFRDPFVWIENESYFMLVGTGDEHNGGGNAALYVSADGLNWESCGMLVDYDYEINQKCGHVWELPVLLPLRDDSGKIVCHIMMFCACQIENDIVETYYFLGTGTHQRKHSQNGMTVQCFLILDMVLLLALVDSLRLISEVLYLQSRRENGHFQMSIMQDGHIMVDCHCNFGGIMG